MVVDALTSSSEYTATLVRIRDLYKRDFVFHTSNSTGDIQYLNKKKDGCNVASSSIANLQLKIVSDVKD
jgi:hypothetical protein